MRIFFLGNRLSWGLVLFFTLLGVARPTEEPAVIVKGLSEGSAILEVNKELVIYREGERKRGIGLISANNKRAKLDIAGKIVTLGLDQSIAESYATPAPRARSVDASGALWREPINDTSKRGRTRITAVRLMEEKDSGVTLEVDYFYAGTHAEEVKLAVRTLKNGRSTGSSLQRPDPLLTGSHSAILEIGMSSNTPLVYYSDAIEIVIFWSTDGARQEQLARKVIPFPKYWKRVSVR